MLYNLINKSALIFPILIFFIQYGVVFCLPELTPVQIATTELASRLGNKSNTWHWMKYKTRLSIIKGKGSRRFNVLLSYYDKHTQQNSVYNVQLRQAGDGSYELVRIKTVNNKR